MIDYFDGYILLAFRDMLIYVKVGKEVVQGAGKNEPVIETVIDESEIRKLDLSKNYKIVSI